MPVRTERHDRTLLITLDRPEAMNSIDADMYAQLGEAWNEFEHDDGLMVAVVTGAGEKAFCAGRDLVKSVNDPEGDWSQRRETSRLTPDGIWKPVIGAINGHCLAAGLALALGCDVRVASTNATFGTMAAKRGIVAGGGQTQRLALAMHAMKRAAYEGGMDMPLTEGLRHEMVLYNEIMQTEDASEGGRAFAEKRAARFVGR